MARFSINLRDLVILVTRLAEFKNRSRQIGDVTATMRFELLAFVAGSLCELLDSIGAGAEFPVEPIACHLDALSLSARADFRALRPDQVPELTKGLRRVVEQRTSAGL